MRFAQLYTLVLSIAKRANVLARKSGLNSRGVSLIEALLAAGLGLIAVGSLGTMVFQMSRQLKVASVRAQPPDIRKALSAIVNSEEGCVANFVGLNYPQDPLVLNEINYPGVNAGRIVRMGESIDPTRVSMANGGEYTVTDIRVTAPAALPDRAFAATVQLTLAPTNPNQGLQGEVISVPLKLFTNPAGIIRSCTASEGDIREVCENLRCTYNAATGQCENCTRQRAKVRCAPNELLTGITDGVPECAPLPTCPPTMTPPACSECSGGLLSATDTGGCSFIADGIQRSAAVCNASYCCPTATPTACPGAGYCEGGSLMSSNGVPCERINVEPGAPFNCIPPSEPGTWTFRRAEFYHAVNAFAYPSCTTEGYGTGSTGESLLMAVGPPAIPRACFENYGYTGAASYYGASPASFFGTNPGTAPNFNQPTGVCFEAGTGSRYVWDTGAAWWTDVIGNGPYYCEYPVGSTWRVTCIYEKTCL
ncbi:MAG: hypothetical protein COT74_12260 [Bdellovibrionales bacterium CG10_big_fil_rev_8_21_14_0_10_45_34]|nr:MAG: hypothetical protein COT74_12260 [Bdellovibrionales bacterium CG10_big_fil_rev_8_21_14_0_10_45_34]